MENLGLKNIAVGLEDGVEIILGKVELEASHIQIAELLGTRGLCHSDLEGLVLKLTAIQTLNGCRGLSVFEVDEIKNDLQ